MVPKAEFIQKQDQMRAVLTLVVQLLVDSDQPDDLRGSLRNIRSEAAPVNFRSEAELLAQIKRWAKKAAQDKPAENHPSGAKN
jgi:hypothetical protein